MVNIIPLFAGTALLKVAAAHGHIQSLIANSKTYTDFLPVGTPDFSRDAPSVVRKQNLKEGAETDVNAKGMACTKSAVPINDNGVSRVAEIAAGSKIQYKYNGWPHNGPVTTYMARCDPDCGSFTGDKGAVWFKTEEYGYSDGKWVTLLFNRAGWWWNSTIPACLEPGEYLVRHELINISGCRVKKCEFYPECVQVKVTGTGTAKPKDLVSFPGAYSYADPGIGFDTNTQKPEDYVIPGPPVFKCPSSS